MSTAERSIPRTDLVLPRFLAMVLFGLAALMGLPMAAAVVVSLFAGKWQAALLMTSVLPIVWATVWLGKVIWSGRSIPMWFVFALGGLIAAEAIGRGHLTNNGVVRLCPGRLDRRGAYLRSHDEGRMAGGTSGGRLFRALSRDDPDGIPQPFRKARQAEGVG